MKFTRYLLAIGLLAFAVQARADYTVDDIYDDVIDIYNDMIDVWNTVTGDVKATAHDLKQQLDMVTAQGQTVRDTVQDALNLVQHRDGPFNAFLYYTPGAARCGDQSECMNFRLDLENFVLDMAALKDRFPQIEQHGLGDGTIAVDVISVLPPLVLFSLYETLNQVPNWQDTPQDLANLYDEVGDPDAFSAEPLGASQATAARFKPVAAKANCNGQACFGSSPASKLNTFCSKGKQLKDDPVRLNRVRMVWTWNANMLDGVGEVVPEEQNVDLAGEGGSVPIPLGALMKLGGKVIESIFASVDTYRANLGLCRQIETDVAQRASLVDYRDPKGVTSAYWVVYGILVSRQAQGLDETTANADLNAAGSSYGAAHFPQAYSSICDAYAALN